MAFIDNFADMLTQDITVETEATYDEFGKPTFNAATAYKARVIYKNDLVRDSQGREIVAKGTCWIKGHPDLFNGAQVALPDGTSPDIISVERLTDEDGETHTKLYFA